MSSIIRGLRLQFRHRFLTRQIASTRFAAAQLSRPVPINNGPEPQRRSTSPWINLLLAAGLGSIVTGSVILYHPQSQDTRNEKEMVYATREEMRKAVSEIQRKLGEESISTDDEDLVTHGYSEWSSINIDSLPVAVAFPKSTEEVATIARICHEYRVPMIPYSGGSSVEGHFSAPFGGVSVDFLHMDRIVEFHPDE
ncbi:FAD-binding oxidoreductase [Aspergillus puulaauensis]|uniref:FAD-binding PCMH-type domain-containing protein n=1 Tax=Aspergillus puulaauensis TaxID=1220207 RepID=A0A7R8AQN9_9EURO|nr:uncharacterized protein APUU_70049A [Aspergillus puulaauensis]BCS28479.1 hypothetical protein APUU_70049A [Aspergillus puulaauensis]